MITRAGIQITQEMELEAEVPCMWEDDVIPACTWYYAIYLASGQRYTICSRHWGQEEGRARGGVARVSTG